MDQQLIEAIERLFKLKESGAIDDAEYSRLKSEIINSSKSNIGESTHKEEPKSAEEDSESKESWHFLTELSFWPLGKFENQIFQFVGEQVREQLNVSQIKAFSAVKSATATWPCKLKFERTEAIIYAAKLRSLGAAVELNPPETHSETKDAIRLKDDFVLERLSLNNVPSPTITTPRTGAGGIICPHCETRGMVSKKTVHKKKGISGGKAVAGIMTGGWSAITPGVGLSRKDTYTQLTCRACRMVWVVES